MDPRLQSAARAATGFMPHDEGMALYEAAVKAGRSGPLLEIGSYCGKSAIYLGAAARVAGTVVYSIDHHRGSQEHQPGEAYFDEALYDLGDGHVDTLPAFRRTIEAAGLSDVVVPIVAASKVVAKGWATPLGLAFIDGGHSEAAANADYDGWARHVLAGGVLAIHDVFPDPVDGGRPPYEIYRRALASGAFQELSATGSLRLLRRAVAEGRYV